MSGIATNTTLKVARNETPNIATPQQTKDSPKELNTPPQTPTQAQHQIKSQPPTQALIKSQTKSALTNTKAQKKSSKFVNSIDRHFGNPSKLLNQNYCTGFSMCDSNDASLTKRSTSSNPKKISSKTDKRLNALINNKYVVFKRLGSGSFGDLYIGTVVGNDTQRVAIKFENASDRSQQLQNEVRLYKILGDDQRGFPTIHHFGQWGEPKSNVLVMDLLGKTLEEIFEICEQDFTLKTIILLALQLLNRFEFIHSKNILYRDVKPENFLLGRPGTPLQNVVHIVDFGLSREYIDPLTKKHIVYRENRSLTGTARYMSINTHQGIEQSRRDDLQSLAHLFTYFLRKGKLPWSGLKAQTVKERYRKIGDCKATMPVDKLLEGQPQEFQDYLVYTRGLKFEEDPDYTMWKSKFEALMKSKSYEDDGKYDWDGKYTA